MIKAQRFNPLSGNVIKILAAIFMVIDHVGLLFFPSVSAFRIIGRLAFPLFAFMISEGARYTKNKLKYFLTIFILAFICQVVYYFFDGGSLYMCILVTFSISLAIIFAMQYAKRTLFDKDATTPKKLLSVTLFILSLLLSFWLNTVLDIDYGFIGCMAPVFASLLDFRGTGAPEQLVRFDTLPCRIVCFTVAILLMCISYGGIQAYALLAIPLLLLYSGRRGTWKMKYFFYLFYPIHLVVLEAIYIITYFVK